MPADTKIEVTKGNTAIDGKSAIDEASKNVVTFDATAKFTTGTYTLTATLGETKVSADVEVKDSYVAEIKITSKEALTGNERQSTTSGASITMKDAYIYYDVLNQYGESIRNATTINWTTSVGNEGKKIDKSLGKITVSGDSASLNYGTLIYVTGVHVSSGTTISASIPVGMAQAVNTVEFAGFINKDASTKLVESLPVNFPNNKYVLAYRTFDQNGNPLEVTGKEVNESKLTFISDNVLLIDPSSFKDAGTFTIDGVQYSAVTINPGDYVGKGGEVNITAIANKTGQKTVKNFVIGSAGVLQSLTLDTPASVVADGDQWVKLPYTAKDADGKNVTNYETIVRSSNALNLTAGDGTLYVMEENDGTAGVYWCDDASKATTFNDSSEDGIDRSVSLGTMVIGGESNMMILPVSDARRPVAFKSIKLNSDDNNAIVDKNTATIDFYSNDVVYLDQYGSELKGGDHASIIKGYFDSTVKGNKHGIRVKSDDKYALLGLDLKEKVYSGRREEKSQPWDPTQKYWDSISGESKIDIAAASRTEDSTTIKFSIVTAPSSASYGANEKWDNVDNEKSIEYTVVPIDAIKGGFSISKIGKQEIATTGSELANFEAVKNNATGTAISIDDPVTATGIVSAVLDVNGADSNAFSVTGIYNGKSVTIPGDWYECDTTTGSAFTADIQDGKGISKLTNIVAGELTWAELYDQNSAKGTRIDAIKELRLIVKGAKGTELEKPKTRVTISDAKAVASNIRFYKDWYQYDPKEATLLPDDTNISVKKTDKVMNNGTPTASGDLVKTDCVYKPWNGAKLGWDQWGNFQIRVFDQYGKLFKHDDGSYADITVSDIKESTSEFTHLPNSFKVVQNGSSYNNLKITGAEIGDTFTLTATIPGTNISTSVKVTVGADTQAYVAASNITGKAKDADKDFRMTELGYKK